jgi:hypothetical protein
MKSCIKESMIVPQLLYLPGVHFNPADGAGDRFILAFSNAV